MDHRIIRAGALVGLLALTGCSHDKDTVRSAASATKSTDPTAWTDKDIPKDGATSGTSNGLARSSRLSGGLDPESRDIERSLGVGP